MNSQGHAAIVSEGGVDRAAAALTNFPFVTSSAHTVDGDRTPLPVVIPANFLGPQTNPDGTISFVASRLGG